MFISKTVINGIVIRNTMYDYNYIATYRHHYFINLTMTRDYELANTISINANYFLSDANILFKYLFFISFAQQSKLLNKI